jgi:hypothetical protein
MYMDKKTLVNNLHAVFSSERKEGGMYTKVWLSQPVVLGFYRFSKYILYVQTETKKNNYFDEISAVVDLLDEKANTELRSIMRVDVHHCDDGYYCQGGDLLVFEVANNWE